MHKTLVQTVEQVTGTVTLTDAIDYTITSSSEPFCHNGQH